MKPGFSRTAAILLALLLGSLIPQAQAGAWIIRWLLMSMLFLMFLQTRLSRQAVRASHVWLVATNLAMGFAGWGLGWLLGGREVALAGFFCGITPTATAAPVIMSFLRGKVDYVVAAFLLTNLIVAALLPALMPFMLGRAVPTLFADALANVAVVVFAPLALAALLRKAHPRAAEWPKRLRNVSFGLWIATLFLVTARVSAFLREHTELPLALLLAIGGLSLVLCAANFSLGRLIGGREFAREASQALGQKNTAFTIYIALTYASPLVALGPTCYVLWHNLWNSWQLHRQARQEAAAPPAR